MPISMQSMLFAESEVATQFALVLVWALVWNRAFRLLTQRVVKPWVSRQPWKAQFVQLSARSVESFGVKVLGEEHAFDIACESISVFSQHAVGGALCLPSVLGAGSPAAAAMARHGALSEAGWEAGDIVVRLGQRLFGGEEGRAKNPTGLLVFLVLHHALGMGLVLPMNLVYGSNPLYHEMVFILQFAGFVAMAAQSYGFTLDVNSAGGLLRMRVTSIFVLVTMGWSRVLRFLPLAFACLSTLYGDGHLWLLFAAGPALCCMGVVNALLVFDSIKRTLKYACMRLEPAQDKKAGGSTLLGSRPAGAECGGKRPEERASAVPEQVSSLVQRR